jgi:hypothetical protein
MELHKQQLTVPILLIGAATKKGKQIEAFCFVDFCLGYLLGPDEMACDGLHTVEGGGSGG